MILVQGTVVDSEASEIAHCLTRNQFIESLDAVPPRIASSRMQSHGRATLEISSC
jgi:hypothetical protein